MTAARWNPDFYKTGYEGFERLENFPTPESMQAYRTHLLEKSAEQAQFIEKALGKRKLRVIEFGAGNGRLLVALAQRGLIESAIGIDISQSRIAFANKWATDIGLKEVKMIAADALTFDRFDAGTFDLAICITGTFGYLQAIRESAPAELLDKMQRALRPRGTALFELYQLPAKRRQLLELNDGRLRTWQPLPAEDRFAYYLDDFEYFADANALRHGKIFIGRDGSIDAGREEVLTYYTRRSFGELLRSSGFTKPRFAQDFVGTPYKEGKSATMVVAANRLSK